MNTIASLTEIKELFNQEHSFETDSNFIVNQHGKYKPNLTFVVDKTMNLQENGKLMNPVIYHSDKEVTGNMNVDFNGNVEFAFGNFWHSKKGAPCFHPEDPAKATHMLIAVHWGGAFNHNGYYGYSEDTAKDIEGVEYFHKARSNGGGLGTDYWIVPVGFQQVIHDPEVDKKPASTVELKQLFAENAKNYRQKFSDMEKAAVQKADDFLKEKARIDQSSKENKDKYMPELLKIQEQMNALQHQKHGDYGVPTFTFGETEFTIGIRDYPYTEESIQRAHEELQSTTRWITEHEQAKDRLDIAKQTLIPKFEALAPRLANLGLAIDINTNCNTIEDVRITVGPPDYLHTPYGWDVKDSYKCTEEDLQKCTQQLVEKEEAHSIQQQQEQNQARIDKILEKAGLPKSLWPIFANSEDTDQVIQKECEAINKAWTVEKDGMDLHELRNCGIDRRMEAINRVLERAGGTEVKLQIYSQSLSRELASYLTGDMAENYLSQDYERCKTLVSQVEEYAALKESFDQYPLDMSYEDTHRMTDLKNTVTNTLLQQPGGLRPQLLHVIINRSELTETQSAAVTEAFSDIQNMTPELKELSMEHSDI